MKIFSSSAKLWMKLWSRQKNVLEKKWVWWFFQSAAAHSQSLLLWKILIIPCTLLYCHNTIKVWIQSKRRGKRCNNYVFWKKALLLLSVVSQIHITSAHYASFPTFCLDDKSVYHTVKTDGYVLGKDKAVSVQCIPKVIKPFQTFSFRDSNKNSTSMWNKKQFCFIL